MIILTENMAMENFIGLMAEYIRAIGRMVDKMAEVDIKDLMELREMVNGKMVKK